MTGEFSVDHGSGLCWGKLEVPCLQCSNILYVYENTAIFCNVYMVSAVDKFYVRLVINGGKKIMQHYRLMCLTGSICFPVTVIINGKGLWPCCAG